MKGLSEYGATRASTVHPYTIRFQLAYSTSLGFTHCTYGCTNAFQCTFEDDPTKRIYCYPPPFYLTWYNLRYPHDPIDVNDGPFLMFQSLFLINIYNANISPFFILIQS